MRSSEIRSKTFNTKLQNKQITRLKSSIFEINTQASSFEELNSQIFLLSNELKRKASLLEDMRRKNDLKVIALDPTEVLLEINNEKILLKLELEQKKIRIKELDEALKTKFLELSVSR